jgi:hypothetical protein
MKAIFKWREVNGKHLLEQVAAKLLWELVSLEKLTSFLNPRCPEVLLYSSLSRKARPNAQM